MGQRDRQQRSADAIAHGRHVAFAGCLFNRVQRAIHALAHVALEILLGVAFVGIDPGHDKHRQPLRHRPAHEAFFGIEVEDIELVDPWRKYQQRPFQDIRC